MLKFIMSAMRAVFFVSIFLMLPCSLISAATQEETEKAEQLGEEFQRQAPWFKERPKSGEFYGTPQPDSYIRVPEKHSPKYPQYLYPQQQYPLCYDPYKERFEYCYRGDSNYFILRFRQPKFRLWWEVERFCPQGYYFVPDRGCYRR